MISDQKITTLSKIAYDACRAYHMSIGSDTLPTWDNAPDILKETVEDQICAIVSDPHFCPQDHHDAWCQMKSDDGWTQGDIYDEDTKTHPDLKPYGELSSQDRFEDALIHAIVMSYLNFG